MSHVLLLLSDEDGNTKLFRFADSTLPDVARQVEAMPAHTGIRLRTKAGATGDRHLALSVTRGGSVVVGDIFESASDAARAIGCSQPSIAQAFKASGQPPFAFMVRGVVLVRLEKLGMMFRNVDWDSKQDTRNACGEILNHYPSLANYRPLPGAAQAARDAGIAAGLGLSPAAQRESATVYPPGVVAAAKSGLATTQAVPPPVARPAAPTPSQVAAAQAESDDIKIGITHAAVPEGDL